LLRGAFQDRAQPVIVTHGDLVRRRYGVEGARGEAASGFQHVVRNGLETMRQRRREGCREQVCRLTHAILIKGGCATAQGRKWARNLDQGLAGRRISPGRSADLLAAAIFLDAVERQSEVPVPMNAKTHAVLLIRHFPPRIQVIEIHNRIKH
jgi:triphosphoribosyl-dephospho-CoA synthase